MNNIVYPEEQIIKTDKGIFHLKIGQLKNRDTGIIETYTVNIGSKDNKCCQLRIPSREVVEKELQLNTVKKDRKANKYNENVDGYLMWVQSDIYCSLEQYIKKGLAQHMVLLGSTIIQDINPLIERVYFLDTSNFTCELPDGKKEKVPMKEFYIAFHGATWYEYNFNARRVVDWGYYLKLKEGFDDPARKPAKFDFMNSGLDIRLKDIYNNTSTWRELFDAISDKWGSKKCGIVYPWLVSALYEVFDNRNAYENVKWYINLNDNNKVRPVEFISYLVKRSGGGKRKTRKVRKSRKNMVDTRFERVPHFFPNIPEIMGFDYSAF